MNSINGCAEKSTHNINKQIKLLQVHTYMKLISQLVNLMFKKIHKKDTNKHT